MVEVASNFLLVRWDMEDEVLYPFTLLCPGVAGSGLDILVVRLGLELIVDFF